MNTDQTKTLLDFVFRPAGAFPTKPNPYVPGKAWRIGDSYTQEETNAFTNQWKDFASQHPDIMAQLPIRN